MKTSLLIVTYHRDFVYLKECLRSVEKFATGFFELAIQVPIQDLDELKKMVSALSGASGIPIRCIGLEEWPDKGMLFHELQIVSADLLCPDADFIMHIDADVIFTSLVTPETFFKDGKPVLRFETFESITKRHDFFFKWKAVGEASLPFECLYETMRAQGMVYHRELYGKTRELISQKTGKSPSDYIHSCENSYPQSFSEHITLGNVAMKLFRENYSLFDCATQSNPDRQEIPIVQFWSHGSIGQPQEIWILGEKRTVVPIDMINAILGLP